MEVPARKTSKSKKRKRRGHDVLKSPTLSIDPTDGKYVKRHHISLKAYKEKIRDK